MANELEVRIINLAQKITDMYIDDLDTEKYQEVCHAIHVCREYVENHVGDWGDLYEVVEGDGGLWEYVVMDDLPEKLEEMYVMVHCVLACMCYIACEKENTSQPEDLELCGENIPEFIELAEKVFSKTDGYQKCMNFWGNNICYYTFDLNQNNRKYQFTNSKYHCFLIFLVLYLIQDNSCGNVKEENNEYYKIWLSQVLEAISASGNFCPNMQLSCHNRGFDDSAFI